MPTRVVPDDDEQQIADLEKAFRRLRARLATTSVKGTHDEFTVAATPETEFQLTYIPVFGTCAMYVDSTGDGGLEQEEDTDYSVDYDTGLVTFDTALTTGDRINFRYLVTDWLIARSLPEEWADLDGGSGSSSTAYILDGGSASAPGSLTVDGGSA